MLKDTKGSINVFYHLRMKILLGFINAKAGRNLKTAEEIKQFVSTQTVISRTCAIWRIAEMTFSSRSDSVMLACEWPAQLKHIKRNMPEQINGWVTHSEITEYSEIPNSSWIGWDWLFQPHSEAWFRNSNWSCLFVMPDFSIISWTRSGNSARFAWNPKDI